MKIFKNDYDFGVVPVYKVVKTTNLVDDDEDDEKWLSKKEVDKIGGWITFNEEGQEGKITENEEELFLLVREHFLPEFLMFLVIL